jgi:hypothetical protein
MCTPLHPLRLAALVALATGCGGNSTNAIGHADTTGSGGTDAGRSSGGAGGSTAGTGGSASVADSSLSCGDLGRVPACPGKVSSVRVDAMTPDGTLVFDRGWLSYGIGFTIATGVTFATSADPKKPHQLWVTIQGNPIEGNIGLGGGEPGDHEAYISLSGCNASWETKGTLTVLRHDFARHDGGYDATLEAVLRTAEGGWAIDAHFTVSGVCAVNNTT